MKVIGIKTVARMLAGITLLGLAGCAGFGPGTVARDRFDYHTAISESWKSQMLINLVKLRYGDAPVFLDVNSVISGYTIEAGMGLGAQWWSNPYSTNQALSATGKYTDRPTITYSPLVGEQFARSLMTPIPPAGLLTLIQAGYPADLVFRVLTHSINGIRNSFGGGARMRNADPEFFPLLGKLRAIQESGAMGLRMKKIDKDEAVVLFFQGKADQVAEADVLAVRTMLGLDPRAQDLKVVYGSLATNDREIAVLTRSVLEILIDLASMIEVPAQHVTERRVNPTVSAIAAGAPVRPLVRIQSSQERPADALVAVPYRDYWYYIDDRDLPSKGIFSFLMFVFTLVEKGGTGGGPVVTIPAG
jgi:hypothetical protein